MFLYRITIFPFEIAYQYLFSSLHLLIGSYGFALVLMSICTTLFSLPFMRYAAKVQNRERHIQDILKPQIEKIHGESTGAEEHRRIMKLYRRYSYHPIYSIRSALGVLIQVPFLMGAYYMLSKHTGIQGESFGPISDLSRPDRLLFGLNLLPVLMTLINLVSACVTPGFGKKEIRQAWLIAGLFLLLLYKAPSALLIFWTCNNLWGFLLNIYTLTISGEKATLSVIVNQMGAALSFHANGRSRIGFSYAVLFLLTLQSIISFSLNADSGKQAFIAFSLSALLVLIVTFMQFFSLYSSACNSISSEKRFHKIAIIFLVWFCIFVAWFKYLQEIGGLYIVIDVLKTHYPYLKQAFFKNFLNIFRTLMLKNLPGVLIICASHFCAAFVLLFTQNAKRISPKSVLLSIYNKSALKITFLAVLAPATFQAINNLNYLSISTVWFYYMLLFLFAFTTYTTLNLIAITRLSNKNIALLNAVYIFVFVINPTLQHYFKMYGASTIVFAILFIPISLLVFHTKIHSKHAVSFFLIIFILSFLPLVMPHSDDDIVDSKSENQHKVIATSNFTIDNNDKESVFFLVYDAMPDIRTAAVLGIDLAPLEALLQDNGFKIYMDTYSIRPTSQESMARTYHISDSATIPFQQLQRMCAGDSLSYRIFSMNGYKTSTIQGVDMTGGVSFVDEIFPSQNRLKFNANSVLVLLKGIFMGEFWFDIVGLTSLGEDEFHSFLQKEMAPKKEPWFVTMHVGRPGHSQNSGKLLPNETDLFIDRLNKCMPDIKMDIETIRRENPQAIIIVLGDHGPYLTGDGLDLAGYAPEDITELMIRDRFGTLVAIHWPDPKRAAKYDKNLLVNQDIFPVVFAYLADLEEPLSLMIKNKKAVYKDHVFINNGTFIPYTPQQ